jgi:acyl-[acyl-carrier-protein]-phospholipid O-acyltransferase/long-chain-fatty-acid--[acyl-carrier-protein] ligase
MRIIAKALFRVNTRGFADQFRAGKLMIVANHESLIDGLLLGLFLPVNPVFVVFPGAGRLRHYRMAMALNDYLVVDPASPPSVKKIIRVLVSGRPIVVFPEGRMTETGALMKVYDIPALVAARTGATIAPVRIDGAAYSLFSALSSKVPRRLFPRITLTALPATRIALPEAGGSRQRRQKVGEELRRIMQETLVASRPEQTLFSALLDTAERFGRSRKTVEDIGQTEYSYGDLIKASFALGRVMAKTSKPGETIGVLLPNIMPAVSLVFGLNALGRTPALLNFTAGTEGIQSACAAALVKTIVTSRAFLEQANLTEKVSAVKDVRLVFLEDVKSLITPADKLWLVLWALRFPRAACRRQAPNDPAVVLFTSGSEDRPKGVLLSHDALLSNVAQMRAIIDFCPDDKILCALPLFHAFGLNVGAMLPVLSGARVFLYPSPLHYRIIPEIAYSRSCSILLGTNSFLGHYARVAHPYDFYRMRYVVAGAEKLTEAVRAAWFEKFGLRVIEGYGATEASPLLAVNVPMAYRKGTVGQMVPGIRYKITPVEGISRGGALHVYGPNLMSGYLRESAPGMLDRPASEVGPGWYNTGDIVDIDDDGFVHIVGRIKRFAKVAGEMISLETVEKIACTASSAFIHAAVSTPDAGRGEKIVLYTTDKALTRERLLAAAKDGGWPEIAIPRKITPVEEFPMLGTGKIDYVTLGRQAKNLRAPARAAS